MGAERSVLVEQVSAFLHLEPRAREEVARELQAHLEDRVREFAAAGLGEEEAVRRASLYFGRPRVIARQLDEIHNRGPWGDVALASLPAVIATPLFAFHVWQRWLAVLAFFIIIASVTLYGWWQGKPAWLFPWVGFALTPVAVGGYFAAFTLIDRPWSRELTPQTLMGLTASAVYFPPALFVVLSTAAHAIRRDWVLASLMLIPTVPAVVWIAAVNSSGSLLHPDMALVAGYDQAMTAVLLAVALTAAAFIRIGKRSGKLGVLLVAPLLTLLIISYNYDGGVAFWAITGRAILLLALLLSPALLDFSLARRPVQPAGHSTA